MEGHGSSAPAVRLLGLDGFVVLAAVEVSGEVELLVEMTETVTGCPGCGVLAEPHGRRPFSVRDLPIAGRPVVLGWVRKASESEPPMTCRNRFQWRRNRGMTWAPGQVWGKPADCPDGVRHVGGASLIWALARNVGTCRPDTVVGLPGRRQQGDPQAANTAPMTGSTSAMTREIVGWETSNSSAITSWVRLFLKYITVAITAAPSASARVDRSGRSTGRCGRTPADTAR